MAKKAVGNLAIIVSANTEALAKGFRRAGKAASTLKKTLGAALFGGKGGGGGRGGGTGKDGATAGPRFGALNAMTGGGGAMGLAAAAMPGMAAFMGVQAAIGRVSQEFSEATTRIQALADTAAKLGMTTRALNGLRYAAEQSGVPTQTLDMALQRMPRRVAEAAIGTGEAQGALKEMGLDAKKLVGLSPEKQFLAISDAAQKAGMSGHQLRLAFKMFDSEGAALKVMFDKGADAIKKMSDEGNTLNGTLASDDAMVAEFNEEALKMQKAMEGLWNEISVMMIPIMLQLATGFKNTAVQAKNFFRRLTGRDAMPELVGIHPKQMRRIAERKAREDQEVKDAEERAKKEKKAAEKAAEEIKRASESMTQSMRTPLEKAREKFAEINRLFQAGAIDATTYQRAIRANNKELLDSAKTKPKPDEQMRKSIAAVGAGTVAGFSAVIRGKEAQRAATVQRRRLIKEAEQRRRLLEQISTNTAPRNRRVPSVAGVLP